MPGAQFSARAIRMTTTEAPLSSLQFNGGKEISHEL